MWDPYAEFEVATLPNGLTIHAAHWPGRPWEAVGFLIHTGAEHDPIGKEGLAHFLEHVVGENGTHSSKKVRQFFDDLGGFVEFGTTGYPFTSYKFLAPAEPTVLTKAFSIFGGMLLAARLEKNIERERQVIFGEFRRAYPLKFRHDLLLRQSQVVYAGHTLGRFACPLGTIDSVAQISPTDLQSHYDAHYTPANMSIVAVGGMSLQNLVTLLESSPFALSKPGMRTPLPKPLAEVTRPTENRHVFQLSEHYLQPTENYAYRSVVKIPGVFNSRHVRIMQKMLNSVLFDEVRERRAWTYSIGCSVHNFHEFYEFDFSCRGLQSSTIDDIEEVVESCIASIVECERLFEKLKHQYRARTTMIDPNGKGVISGALDDLADWHRIVTIREVQNDIERAQMSDIVDMLPWLRREQRWTLITRP